MIKKNGEKAWKIFFLVSMKSTTALESCKKEERENKTREMEMVPPFVLEWERETILEKKTVDVLAWQCQKDI